MSTQRFLRITLVINKKTGVMSFLMRNGGKLGLLYKHKFERTIDNDTSRVLVYFYGESNQAENATKNSFLEHPDVLKIEEIAVVSSADMRSKPRPESAPA